MSASWAELSIFAHGNFDFLSWWKKKSIVSNIILFTAYGGIRSYHTKKLHNSQKPSTMVRISHCGGIGTVGSAFAQYFHPSQNVRDAHPNDWKTKRFSDVTIVRDGMETVHHKQQRCYFCNIPSIDQILYIVTANFKVEQPPAIVFEAERRPTNAPGEITAVNNSNDNWRSLQNVEPNVASSRSTNEDIIELCHPGIQVDDDNEPAPENAWALPQSNQQQWGNLTLPQFVHIVQQEL